MKRAALLGATLVGCAASSGNAPRGDSGSGSGSAADARPPVVIVDAAPAPVAGARSGYRLAPTVAPLEVRVEWASAAPALRARPGVTPCGTPRPPRVAVHTLGGVAGALVIAEIDAGRALPAATPTTIAVTGCVAAPRLTVVPTLPATVELRSQDARRHALTIREVALPMAAALGDLRFDAAVGELALPWAGAAVRREVAAPAVLQVVLGDTPDDPAWVVATGTPYAGVTDETGAVQLGDAPAGTFPVTAWLPPAAGQAARVARGTVTVVAGAPASLTLRFDEAP